DRQRRLPKGPLEAEVRETEDWAVAVPCARSLGRASSNNGRDNVHGICELSGLRGPRGAICRAGFAIPDYLAEGEDHSSPGGARDDRPDDRRACTTPIESSSALSPEIQNPAHHARALCPIESARHGNSFSSRARRL